jgi:hypothetical protein
MDDLKHDLPRPDGNGPHGQIGAGFVSALPPPKKVQMTDLQRPAAAVRQQKREKSIELRQPGVGALGELAKAIQISSDKPGSVHRRP